MAQAISRSLLNKEALPLMWCAGCGNGIVLNALLCAMDELNLKKEDVLVVTGIGCWGKADDYISANALHTTHGRALTFATGIGLAMVAAVGWMQNGRRRRPTPGCAPGQARIVRFIMYSCRRPYHGRWQPK